MSWSRSTAICGGVVSTTDTVDVHSALLPLASSAWNVTVVTPSGNIAGALCVITGDGSVSSLADAPARDAAMVALVAGVPLAPAASTWMVAGHVICGGVVSALTTSSSNFVM